MHLDTLPPAHGRLQDLLIQLVRRDRALQSRLHKARMIGEIDSWPLTTYNPGLPIVDDRIMLLGDAAGLINPLNGEGIQYALLSARWASDVVATSAEAGDFSKEVLSAYSNRVEKELKYSTALSEMIVQLIRNRSLNPLWLRALNIVAARARMHPDYANITSGVLAGLIPSTDALSLKVILGTLEQAAISTGIDAAIHTLKGPKHLAKIGLETAGWGFEVSRQAMKHPSDFIRWGLESTAGMAGLACQVSTHSLLPQEEANGNDSPKEIRFVIQ